MQLRASMLYVNDMTVCQARRACHVMHKPKINSRVAIKKNWFNTTNHRSS